MAVAVDPAFEPVKDVISRPQPGRSGKLGRTNGPLTGSTEKHNRLLSANPSVCEIVEEVRVPGAVRETHPLHENDLAAQRGHIRDADILPFSARADVDEDCVRIPG